MYQVGDLVKVKNWKDVPEDDRSTWSDMKRIYCGEICHVADVMTSDTFHTTVILLSRLSDGKISPCPFSEDDIDPYSAREYSISTEVRDNEVYVTLESVDTLSDDVKFVSSNHAHLYGDDKLSFLKAVKNSIFYMIGKIEENNFFGGNEK